MTNYIKFSVLVGVLAILPLLTSCKKEIDYIGKETVIESSAKKQPKWVKNPPKKRSSYYYFVGQEDSKQFIDRYAYQRALAELSSFLSTRANTLYEQQGNESNAADLTQYRSEFIQLVSQSSIRGAIRKDRYWEKIGTLKEVGVDYSYRFYVLVQIHKKDLAESEKRTIDMQIKQAENDPAIRAQLLSVRQAILADHQ